MQIIIQVMEDDDLTSSAFAAPNAQKVFKRLRKKPETTDADLIEDGLKGLKLSEGAHQPSEVAANNEADYDSDASAAASSSSFASASSSLGGSGLETTAVEASRNDTSCSTAQQQQGLELGEYRLDLRISKRLYQHQKDGVAWLWTLYELQRGGILADDMGLGKVEAVFCIAFEEHTLSLQANSTSYLLVTIF